MRKARLIPLLLPLALWAFAPGVAAADDQGDKDRRIEQKRQHYKSLPKKKQQQLRNARDAYKNLSPDQQRQLRERYRKQKKKQ